jgi:CelD/BcsL family acetyltransferase involved in cellulose biosynthesis
LQLVFRREIPDDQQLARQWNALALQMERPEIFYTYEWALAVQRAYSASVEPLLILAYQDDSLLGVVTLATDQFREEVFFLTATTADYCDFVCRPDDRARLLDAVLLELRIRGLTTLRLANLPADSQTSRALRTSARRQGYLLFRRPAYTCSQIIFSSVEQRESLKQSVRRKQMFRRYVRAMERIAPVTLNHLNSWNSISTVLPHFSKMHVARFLATGRISNLARAERRMFLAELAKLLSSRGWMVLSGLMLGDRPVAWNYGFQYASSWFWYQPTLDSSMQQYSPGFCLLSKMVEEACDDQAVDRLDLGLGEEGYKERFATAGRDTLHVIATTSKRVYAREAVRHKAATTVKLIPAFEDHARKVVVRVSRMTERLRTDGAPAFLRYLRGCCKDAVFLKSEVYFFEWMSEKSPYGEDSAGRSLTLRPIDLELLAQGAMIYVYEQETLRYLLRAAARLRSEKSMGFALVEAGDRPLHFCWVADFDGFYMSELNHRLRTPSLDSVLLFDCWTPSSVRGQSYYSIAISKLAAQLWASGKLPWIFSAALNESSVRGVEKAGFVRKFSLIRERMLFTSNRIRSQAFTSHKAKTTASSAA